MLDFIFLFDLDSTVTKEEILPTIAKKIGKLDEMVALTEKTMIGEIPFKQSFIERVDILKDIPVNEVRDIVENIALNQLVADFISDHKERCYIVTGNLDIWIEGLIQRLGMNNHYFSSKAQIKDNKLEKVVSVLDKNAVISQFIPPFVAIGDGNNDAEMIEAAEIGIGFGGVRNIAPSVLNCATHAVYKEEVLCQFLKRLL